MILLHTPLTCSTGECFPCTALAGFYTNNPGDGRHRAAFITQVRTMITHLNEIGPSRFKMLAGIKPFGLPIFQYSTPLKDVASNKSLAHSAIQVCLKHARESILITLIHTQVVVVLGINARACPSVIRNALALGAIELALKKSCSVLSPISVYSI